MAKKKDFENGRPTEADGESDEEPEDAAESEEDEE